MTSRTAVAAAAAAAAADIVPCAMLLGKNEIGTVETDSSERATALSSAHTRAKHGAEAAQECNQDVSSVVVSRRFAKWIGDCCGDAWFACKSVVGRAVAYYA